MVFLAAIAFSLGAQEKKEETKEPATEKPGPAKPDAQESKTESEKEPEKEPELTDNFEGPENAGVNWITLSAGGMFTSGNRSQAEQMRQLPGAAFGGIEDLHWETPAFTNTIFTLDGRGIIDNNDYKIILGLKKEEAWFLRFGFENFRTYYNGDGGYYPPDNIFYGYHGDGLELDRGQIFFEGGITPKDKPSVTFTYRHLYRDGEKSSTIWGQTHPLLVGPTVGLTPTIYDIDEKRDILELEVKHHYKATDFGGGVSYEFGTLDNALKISQFPGEPPVAGVPQDRKITDRSDVSYDIFSAHAFSETWFKPDLMFSAGFLFTRLTDDTGGDRIYGDDFDVNYTPNPGNGPGYINLDGSSHKNEYVLNLNVMSTPIKNLTLVPSIRVQREDWDADSTTLFTQGNTVSGPLASDADGDYLEVRERLDARFTGVTNVVLYARGEWAQGRGNLNEDGGIYLGSPVLRESSDERFFQKYSAGVKWYPHRRVSLDVGGYYKNHHYDYDHDEDNTLNNSANRYPAYLEMQRFETYDGYTRVTWRALPNLTFVTRYEYRLSTVDTRPDRLSGLGEVESSEMTSHILAQNVSWAPWSRLYLQAGANYVDSEITTPASDYTQAILDAQNNYWSVNFNSGFVIDNKTDLNLGYSYYRADNYDDNSPFGVPYGAGAEQHGVTVTLSRWLSDKMRLTLRYGYYHYKDDTYGGNTDYGAHTVYSSLEYRF